MAESMLYHAANLSFCYEFDSRMILKCLDSLDSIYKSQLPAGASSWANSPVLGVGSNLYRVIFKICQLCHRTPLQPEDQILAENLAEELRAAEDFEKHASSPETYDAIKSNCFKSSRLYAIAGRTLLYKIRHPELQAEHAWIQSQVREGIDILRSLPTPYKSSQYLCWPIFVIGCGLIRDSDIIFVRQTLKDMWESFFCGENARAVLVLEASWKATQQMRRDTGKCRSVSGLDLLLHTAYKQSL